MLRILYKNVLETATITNPDGVDASFPIANLRTSNKGTICRRTGTTSMFRVTWSSHVDVNCVVVPYSNLSTNATLSIRVFSDTGWLTQIYYTTGPAYPYMQASLKVKDFNQYIATASRIYFPTQHCRSMEITLTDTSLSTIDVSTMIAGKYWEPTYNASFGVDVGIGTTRELKRTQAGDMFVSPGNSYKTLSVPINWLTETDRSELFKLLRNNGTHKPIFVSVFPEDADGSKEQLYQIYGRLSNSAVINNFNYSFYSTSLSLEEV